MSSIRLLRVESRCSIPLIESSLSLISIPEKRRHSLSSTNKSQNEVTIENSQERQIIFEVKTNKFNRNIEIKTKQEDKICTTKNPLPTITCSTQSDSLSTKPPINSSRKSVSVSVASSSRQKEINEKDDKTKPVFFSTLSTSDIENDASKQEDINRLDRRPLFDLINQIDQRNTVKTIHSIPSLDNLNKISPSNILPAKPLSPFKPVILHRKYQEPIGRFDFIDKNEDSSYSLTSPIDHDSQSNTKSAFKFPKSCPSIDFSSSISTESNSSLANTNTTTLPNTIVDDKNEAKRKAIATQMYDTENSYVEALKSLVTKYYLPMKDKNIISNDLINDIFYKIPEIHIHHTAFLISLAQKVEQWDNQQTVGDVFLQMFTRTSVIETYTSFVNNYQTAQIAIGICREISSFNKFLEQQARDHPGKLALRDLIIQPVQRIPRYELFIKDFLRCTHANHPDYHLLLKAQLEIHSLAEQIDQVQKEVGSTDLTVTNNSLEVVQDMIENLNDLVNSDRYYIRHDNVTFQLPSGLKKDRCMFLFNDLIIITSCQRRTGSLHKKSVSSVIVNSPSGKQYIDNTKHKLIMKISLKNVELPTDQLKKTRSFVSTSASLIKSPSTSTTTTLDRHRHLEEDVLILGQMTDLAKTITIPHQQLDDSIKETLNTINKHLLDEVTPLTNNQGIESNPIPDNIQTKSNNIQLIINTTEPPETIDITFSTNEAKAAWEKNYLEAKRILLETAAARRNLTFQHVFMLPHNRPGSLFSCGTIRQALNDLCFCDTEGQICLIDIQSDVTLKCCNNIASSPINSIKYIPVMKNRDLPNPIKNGYRERKRNFISETKSLESHNEPEADSLLDLDLYEGVDEEDADNFSVNDPSINLFDEDVNADKQDTKEATLWIGTKANGLFIYQCSQTINTIGRKDRIVKEFNSAIHMILHTDDKVYLALDHGQLCVFKRDINGQWNFDSPTIKTVDENFGKNDKKTEENDDRKHPDPISVVAFVAEKLWCSIRDRIFVICPNSLNIEHSFVVDDCHRHVCSIATGGSSVQYVWIALQGSHEIRLYHATSFACLLETSIRTIVAQKLQVCDDIVRAHKLGCLHITSLHICKETLWIGTSAGIILNLTISQLIDSPPNNGATKLSSNSIQLKCLAFGHAGPVRFIISTDKNVISTDNASDGTTVKTFVMTVGDGFEDYNNTDETLGKDDALSHLIVWQL